MTHAKTVWLVAAGLLLLGAGDARAQGTEPFRSGYVQVNIGFQPSESDVIQAGALPLYRETLTFDAAQSISGGGMFDINGAVRVWRSMPKLFVGLGYSRTSDSADAAVAASVPHPLLFDAPRTAVAQLTDLQHSENAVHIQAIWIQPVTTEFEIAVFGGPSIFNVRHDLVDTIAIAEAGPPFTTVNVTNVSIIEGTDTAAGINIGVDGLYMVTPRVGGGLFLRYAGATAKLPGAGGQTVEVDVGGFQIGGGVRVRF